jgi:hypothetical protein
MTELRAGDRVDIRVKDAKLVSPYRGYDEIMTFEIVAISDEDCGYYLYVPSYYVIRGTLVADQYVCKRLRIDKRFMGENIIHIDGNMIANVHARLDGTRCSKCQDFYPYAVPNQPNHTLICWSCRRNRYR